MAFQVLRQEVVLQLLEGRESAIPRIAEEDAENRKRVESKLCPKCGVGLKAMVPADPNSVFSGTNINYYGECPTHGRVT